MLVLIGAVLGVPAAFAAGRVISSQMYGLSDRAHWLNVTFGRLRFQDGRDQPELDDAWPAHVAIPDVEINMLKDPRIKAFFRVNPSNSGGRSPIREAASLEQFPEAGFVAKKIPDRIGGQKNQPNIAHFVSLL